MTKSRGLQRRHRFWTEVELELLTRNYADSRTEDLATALERPLHQVYGKAKKLGLAKSEAYLASPDACRLRRAGPDEEQIGKRHQFPKGHAPANKGTRRPGYSVGRGRMQETQFKAGVQSYRTMPVGAHRVIDGCVWRKVSEIPKVAYTANWRAVHRLVWEAANGPIPDGHIVRFRDGMKTVDPDLVTLDRLEMLTHSENLRRNQLPPELQQLARLPGVLTRVINRRAKEAEPA